MSSKFSPVTTRRPCARCGHDSWCLASRDGSAVMCMRDLVGFDGATREMVDGTPYGYHWTGAGSAPTDAPPAPKGIACAPPEVRDRAYRAMLDSFELSEQHRQHLRHRGLSPDQVAALTLAGYRTLPDYHERARAIRAAIDSLGGGDPLAIPGLHRGNSSWRLAGRPGLLIPVRDVAGRIVACKIRPDDPGPDGAKYVWLSSTAHDGASPGAPAHVAAIRTTTGSTALRIVEGVLKADVAAALDPSCSVVGIPSCTAISTARDAMAAIAPGRVLLAWDGDAEVNPHVARGLARAVEVVREVLPGASIAAETWDRAHKGVDDALAAGAAIATREDAAEHAAELIARADAAEAARKAAKAPAPADPAALALPEPSTDAEGTLRAAILAAKDDPRAPYALGVLAAAHAVRTEQPAAWAELREVARRQNAPRLREWDDALKAARPAPTRSAPTTQREQPHNRTRIEITDDERAVNDAVVALLPNEPAVYSRGGSLVRVSVDDSPVDARPPRTESLPAESLREIISQHAAFFRMRAKGNDIVPTPEHPPAWCVAAVHARGQWPGIRPLTGVVDAPVMRRDGTVLDAPGYDAPTGYLFCPRREFPRVPESPTPDDGTAAMMRIADVVSEFPFDIGSDEDDPNEIARLNAAAALAMVLTLVARPMIAGAVPGWLIDAPDAGAGKSLLAKTLAAMGTGQVPDAERWHAEEDEWGKVHLGNLLEGRRVVFFDNVATGSSFGHAGLDGALTQWPLWKGRILGQTGNVSVRNDTLIVATGNNPTVPNDTIRRLVRVRLRPDVERPAEREIVYRYALPGDALTHAPGIITDALTALRAWVVAGRPTTRLVPWGSFEEWAAIVPQVLAWYGYPDIHRTQDGLRAVDDGATALGMLLAGWEALGGDEGRSPSEVLAMLRGSAPVQSTAMAEGVRLVREGVEGLDARRRIADHTPGTLGKLVAKFDGKVIGGRRIGRNTHKGNGARWIVRRTGAEVAAPQEDHRAHLN